MIIACLSLPACAIMCKRSGYEVQQLSRNRSDSFCAHQSMQATRRTFGKLRCIFSMAQEGAWSTCLWNLVPKQLSLDLGLHCTTVRTGSEAEQ